MQSHLPRAQGLNNKTFVTRSIRKYIRVQTVYIYTYTTLYISSVKYMLNVMCIKIEIKLFTRRIRQLLEHAKLLIGNRVRIYRIKRYIVSISYLAVTIRSSFFHMRLKSSLNRVLRVGYIINIKCQKLKLRRWVICYEPCHSIVTSPVIFYIH